MNAKPALIQAGLLMACAMVALGGHGREPLSTINAPAESKNASLQAERDYDRLVLSARNLTWEQVRGFGLIVERRKDMTAAVRAAVADTSARVEPTSEGFILDLGSSGGMGRGGDGVVSLTLASGKVASAPLNVERELTSGFCLGPVLGDWDSDSPLARYVAKQEEVASSPESPAFAWEGDHLVMTVAGASWSDVQAITWRRVEGKDRTAALGDALASGTARLTLTADGFVLEIDDANLAETGEQRAALVLDTGTAVAAPILPAPRR